MKSSYRCLYGFAAVLGLSAVSSLWAADPTTQPLLQFSNLTYLGAFRLPNIANNNDRLTFKYGGNALAYRPGSPGSLFVGCMNIGMLAGEVSIPTPVIATSLNSLPTASLLQPCLSPISGASSVGDILGDLLVYNNKLYTTMYVAYDNSNQARSHYVKASLDLSASDAAGPFAVSNNAGGEGFVSGYMTLIPPEWQPLFGNKHAITGQCCISIISRTSWGPDAFAFNPEDLGSAGAPSVALMWYNAAHPTLGQWNDSRPIDNVTVFWNNSVVPGERGMVIPNGTRSALMFSGQGMTYCYGEGTNTQSLHNQPVPGTGGEVHYCYDPASPSGKGDHGYPYRYEIKAFDLKDWAAVAAGTKNPYDVKPYAVWPLISPTLPFANGTDDNNSGGATFDPATNRIYWAAPYTDGAAPIIHVFQVNGGSTPPSAGSACDLNGDSSTNVTDVQLSVNQAIGVAACTGDINQDSLCNVIDVQRVVNAALGGQCVTQ